MTSNTTNPVPLWTAGLEGRLAVVTGAGRGLGRACALALSAAGAEVVAVSRTQSELESLSEEATGSVTTWVESVTSDAVLQRIEGLNHLDVLINNAGKNQPQPFLDVTDGVLDSMLDLNVRAAFRVARSAARVMVRCGGGSIIHMSSQMGHVGSPKRSVYCATKHALEGLSKAMAIELAPFGIRVNTIAPTFVDTPMTRPMLDDPAFRDFVMRMIPLGRLGQLDDVAAAVLFLASPASAMVTGTSLRIDGGWTAQ